MEVEQGTFTPLAFTTTDGMAEECKRYHNKLVELLTIKKGEDCGSTMSWLRAKDPSTSFSASQAGHESRASQGPSRKLKITLLSIEWESTKGGVSTINRELAIQLAKQPNLEVSMYLPQCSEEDVRMAKEKYHVNLIQARQLIGYKPIDWLSSPPANHEIDFVVGHGLFLGRQVQHIQKELKCKWVQVVHPTLEDLFEEGKFEEYANATSRVAMEKHKAVIQLCELADLVIAIGPKLAEDCSRSLCYRQNNPRPFVLTPSIFSKFSLEKQATEERRKFRVLVFGYGDTKDFKLNLNGYDIATEVFSQYLKEEAYQLVFLGAPHGKEEEVLQELCDRGMKRRELKVLSIKESREDLVRLFCGADLGIMPSSKDGFGLLALEALSTGLPILVSQVSGLGHVLQEVRRGSDFVVDSENPEKWAEAIRNVHRKSRKDRLKDARALSRRYTKKYSWDKQSSDLAKKMFDIFGTHHATEGTHLATEGEQDSSLATHAGMSTTTVSKACVEPTGAGINYAVGTHLATEGEQDSSLVTHDGMSTTKVSKACGEPTGAGINYADKRGKRPLNPNVTPPSKKQRHQR
ncbi:uncharacterized protein [Montipora foliosa]|uniref:uncharacterized protein n=1 Tax=Montipora foliosa TaxID=591990 RepID=UPI0035F10E54